MFGRGRHHQRRGGRGVAELADQLREADGAEPADGPYDEADAPHDDVSRLDLGSMLLPMPDDTQLQVEVDEAGPVRAVHLRTALGQLTVTPFAAPRSGGLWAEVAAEIASQSRGDGTAVEELRGAWGREVHVVTEHTTLRYVGVDGPRWLLRGVAAGPDQSHQELVELLYDVLRETVVVRGAEALPPRSPLPITLPEPMAAQVKQLADARHGRHGG